MIKTRSWRRPSKAKDRFSEAKETKDPSWGQKCWRRMGCFPSDWQQLGRKLITHKKKLRNFSSQRHKCTIWGSNIAGHQLFLHPAWIEHTAKFLAFRPHRDQAWTEFGTNSRTLGKTVSYVLLGGSGKCSSQTISTCAMDALCRCVDQCRWDHVTENRQESPWQVHSLRNFCSSLATAQMADGIMLAQSYDFRRRGNIQRYVHYTAQSRYSSSFHRSKTAYPPASNIPAIFI